MSTFRRFLTDMFTANFYDTIESHSHILPPMKPSKSRISSSPGSYEVTAFPLSPGTHNTTPRLESLFFPVLWSSCDQKANKCSGGSSSWCQTHRLGSLMWGSELSLPWENFCDGIIFQFLGHSRCTRFDYITNVLHLSPHDFLSLDVEYLFGRFQSFLFMAIQKLVVTLIFLWEEVSLRSSTRPYCFLSWPAKDGAPAGTGKSHRLLRSVNSARTCSPA